MTREPLFTGKDIIEYIKENKLENMPIKCAYIHFQNDTDDHWWTINWGKNSIKKRRI